MNKLFTNICIKNVHEDLYHSFRLEAATKKTSIRKIFIEAMKQYREANPIVTESFICPKHPKEGK